MITVYRLFQIIMGIMLSGFIFYLLISYAGDYASVGKGATVQKTLDVFLQDVDNVYSTGIPITFTAFARDDYSSCHPRPTQPPKIFCFIGGKTQETEQLLVPVLMRPDRETLLARSTMDLGWTSLDYVEALSGMTLVFNPLNMDDATWNLIEDITMAFPDTSGYNPKVFFDFCDSSQLLITGYFGNPYERGDFFSVIGTNRDELARCTTSLSERQVLVTISSSCSQSFADSGICIEPPTDGVGYAYITGYPNIYVYKDPADLAALIIGGDRKNVFGNPVGGEAWEFKNQLMLNNIAKTAKLMERRCGIVYQLSTTVQECKDLYLDLQDSLLSIKILAEGDPDNLGDMTGLRTELDLAEQTWQELMNKGCESRGSG